MNYVSYSELYVAKLIFYILLMKIMKHSPYSRKTLLFIHLSIKLVSIYYVLEEITYFSK